MLTVSAAAPAPAAKPAPAADQDNMRYHQVAPGEYPAAIAKLYGLRTDELLRMNGKSKDPTLRVGEKLSVGPKPGGKAAEQVRAEVASKDQKKSDDATAKGTPGKADQKLITVSHKVGRGENIASIAARNNVRPEDLMAWNKLSAKSVIKEGQQLTLRKPDGDSGRDAGNNVKVAKATPEAKGSKVVHTVAPGQNPTVIARQYGVDVSQLFEWNAWPKNRMLQVGDAVVIYKKKP
jgi:LysM repeat protein